MQRSFNRLVPILLGALLICGCAPSFKKFRQVESSSSGFIQHRVNANGNAILSTEPLVFNRQVFERKLNSGISAQVVGNSQYLVVPTFNKRIYFLDPLTGTELTSLVTESAVGSAVALQSELAYYAEEAGGDRLVCLNLVNGKTVWQRRLKDSPGAPIIDGSQVFIGSRDGNIFCLDRWTGDSIWVYASKRSYYSTVSVDSALVVFGTDAGEIIALDRENGKKLWAFQTHGAIYAQALIEGLIYCGSADGSLYALRRTNGELVWKFETTGQIQTTPVRLENRIVFGSDDRTVYCLDAVDGGVLWKYETNGIIHASPVGIGRTIVVANSAGSVYQFGLDGTNLSELQVRGSVEATPACVNEMLYIVTTQRRVYAFAASPDTATVP